MIYSTSSKEYKRHLLGEFEERKMNFGEFMNANFPKAKKVTQEHKRAFLGEEGWKFLSSDFIKKGLHIELEVLDMKANVKDIVEFVKKHNCLEEAKFHIENVAFPMRLARKALGMPKPSKDNLTWEQDQDYMDSFRV